MNTNRVNEIKNLLDYYDDMYYNNDMSLVSDAEYDSMKSEYLALTGQQEYNYVPGEAQAQFGRYKHEFPIRSLSKVNDEATLRSELLRLAPGMIQPKYDGLTVVFYPNKYNRYAAVTRGNGEEGEVITDTVKEVPGLAEIAWGNMGFPVRAEGYMKISDFNAINTERVKCGEEPFQNPRNAVAGMLRNKDASKVRGVSVVCYDMVGCTGTESFKLNTMYRIGLPVPDPSKCFKYDKSNIEAAVQFILNFDRKALDYEIDGLVVKSNVENSLSIYGETGHHPKNACAFKFEAEGGWTKLLRVVYQTGRTGKLTPVAEFEPIEILGSTVTRATLHNTSIMNALKISSDCEVFVIKANDVIPAITKVRNNKGHLLSEPIVCPECGGNVEARVTKDGKGKEISRAHFCLNPICKAKLLANVVHFAKRDALDIDGLAEGTVLKMIDAGLLNIPTDIFKVEEAQIKALEGFAAKSAKTLYNDIQKGRTAPLNKFIYAAGMPNVGRHMSKDIANEFGSFANLMADIKTGGKTLRSIAGIGEISVDNILKYNQLMGILYMSVVPEDVVKPQPVAAPRAGTFTFVVTGKMSQPRGEIEAAIKASGHFVGSAVNSNTDYLACGDKVGATKTNAATAKGVKVITESDMWRIING